MYYLYLDESGGSKDTQVIKDECRFFTLGGIIVNDNSKELFNERYDLIIKEHFPSELPKDFKFHYEELRNTRSRKNNDDSVYKKFDSPEIYRISSKVFDAIKEIDCWLLSVTIDLQKHYTKYNDPITPISYSLYLILERFQYFIQEFNILECRVIYERYNDALKQQVTQTHRKLHENVNFPKFADISNFKICYGDPVTEYMLSFADFFAFLPWIKNNSNCTKMDRYLEIQHRYYNLDHIEYRKRGNVEVYADS